MCRPTVDYNLAGFRPPSDRLDIRAFYIRLSSPAPAELSLVYLPAIGGAALELNGTALPPASPVTVSLRRVGPAGDAAYASAHRVAAADGARFEVYSGEDRAADGVLFWRRGGGWLVECLRVTTPAAVTVAEVVVLTEGGMVMRDKARASKRGLGCGTRLEGIPEEAADVGWGCDCGTCGEKWEVVGEGDDEEGKDEVEMEMETVKWAVEVGLWAVCLGVGLLVSRATARRLGRKRIFW